MTLSCLNPVTVIRTLSVSQIHLNFKPLLVFTWYPHALFNGFSLQKACRFLFLLLYVSVWNSGVCYVGQCGEKWQVFQVNRVAPCTKSLSSRSIYPSFQNESTFTFNFHFKIPHILDISIMIDFELNLFLMSLLI